MRLLGYMSLGDQRSCDPLSGEVKFKDEPKCDEGSTENLKPSATSAIAVHSVVRPL